MKPMDHFLDVTVCNPLLQKNRAIRTDINKNNGDTFSHYNKLYDTSIIKSYTELKVLKDNIPFRQSTYSISNSILSGKNLLIKQYESGKKEHLWE